MTLTELLIGIVVLGILFVIAAGAVRRARAANEGSAISSVRLVVQAETTFSAVCGRGATRRRCPRWASRRRPGHAGSLDGSLAADPVERSGYEFRMQRPPDAITIAADCHRQAAASR